MTTTESITFVCACGRETKHGPVCVGCEERARPTLKSEGTEQADLVRRLRAKGYRPMYIPNGTQGTARRNKIARAMGQEDGAPDVILPLPGVAVAIELKQANGGAQRKAQAEMQALLESCGWWYLLAHGADEAMSELERMGV